MKLRQILEAKYSQDEGVIELTQAPRVPNAEKKKFDHKVNQAWHAGVVYKGENVYQLVYENGIQEFLEKELRQFHESKEREFDGQESYLGYIPSEDAFVMGWDTWVSYQDEWGGSDDMMEGAENMVMFTVEGGGVHDHEVMSEGYGMMYSAGYKALHEMYPSIVDVRLD